MRLGEGKGRLIFGVLGLSLGVLAMALLLSTLPWSLRLVMFVPAILGSILVAQTGVLNRLEAQNRARRALPASTPGLRRLMVWSAPAFANQCLGVGLVGAAPWPAGPTGGDPLVMWAVGTAMLMAAGGGLSIGLRLWEADLIARAIPALPGLDGDPG